jgi:two-component sensor histidine kinase
MRLSGGDLLEAGCTSIWTTISLYRDCAPIARILEMASASIVAETAKLHRRAACLAEFGTFAFREADLGAILDEAARVCAQSLEVPYSKVCKYQIADNDLRVVAGYGWNEGVVGHALSMADESSPQGRAFITGKPQTCSNIEQTKTYHLPHFYPEHSILSTVDVLVSTKDGLPFGVLEVDSQAADAFDNDDVNYLTAFANILAEAVASSDRAEEMRLTLLRSEELVAEKEVLSEELKHRVRNSLHLVYGLLTAELDGEHSEASKSAFRIISQRVLGLAQIYDHLLGDGMTKIINFGEYADALCQNIPTLYTDSDIVVGYENDDLSLPLDDATAMGIIITELVTNAYVHAFPGGAGEIEVALHCPPGRNSAVLTISDNGIGFEEAPTPRHGMQLVRRLVKQLNGTLTFDSDHTGSVWTMVLPVPELSAMH